MAENGSADSRHSLTVRARHKIEIEGVTEVQSFDEQAVVLSTDCGLLTLEGEELRVGTLDIAGGTVAVEGRIDSLFYSSGAPARRGLRGRLFG